MVNFDYLSKLVEENRYTEEIGKQYVDIVRAMSDQREKTAEEGKFINDALEVFISLANLGFRSRRESQPKLNDVNSPTDGLTG